MIGTLFFWLKRFTIADQPSKHLNKLKFSLKFQVNSCSLMSLLFLRSVCCLQWSQANYQYEGENPVSEEVDLVVWF